MVETKQISHQLIKKKMYTIKVNKQLFGYQHSSYIFFCVQ